MCVRSTDLGEWWEVGGGRGGVEGFFVVEGGVGRFSWYSEIR